MAGSQILPEKFAGVDAWPHLDLPCAHHFAVHGAHREFQRWPVAQERGLLGGSVPFGSEFAQNGIVYDYINKYIHIYIYIYGLYNVIYIYYYEYT